jgi:hypothetical protein
MSRADLRRSQKQEQKKTKVFTLTQAQIDQIKEQAMNDAVDKVFILMLALPLEVLITEDYWMKSAKRRLPKFIDEVLSLYKAYEAGSISIEEMEEDLWEFAGVKLDKGGKQ